MQYRTIQHNMAQLNTTKSMQHNGALLNIRVVLPLIVAMKIQTVVLELYEMGMILKMSLLAPAIEY